MELSSALGKCNVFIGESPENWIKKQLGENHVFITDTNIFRLYGNIFAETATIVIGTGEQEKNLSTIQRIYQQLMEFEADRTTVITGIGGGVVCDITGFAASTYMRGLRFNLVPTSLLAQVDASIGGKNGVNLKNYKNIIGTFNQPEQVLLDFSLLKSLSQNEVTSGTGEIVKHALIGSQSLFSYLEKNSRGLCLLESDAVERTVMESIKIKSKIVKADATEINQRRILNFGHTFGHAFEKIYGFNHGEAVSLGIVVASNISESRGLLSGKDKNRILVLLKQLNLPTNIPKKKSKLFEIMKRDKKRERDHVHFVFIAGIGKPIVEKISFIKLEEYFHDLCESERNKS